MKTLIALLVLTVLGIAGTVVAQEVVTVGDKQYVLKRILNHQVVVEAIGKGLEYCPVTCYTDRVQHTRIECRAPAAIEGGTEGSVIDREGNYVGPNSHWTITQTHDIRDISVYGRGCQETRTETIVNVLGSTPLHFPGDPVIEDPRGPYEPPWYRFNCNDYPAEYDQTTGESVVVVEWDLLIKRTGLVCR